MKKDRKKVPEFVGRGKTLAQSVSIGISSACDRGSSRLLHAIFKYTKTMFELSKCTVVSIWEISPWRAIDVMTLGGCFVFYEIIVYLCSHLMTSSSQWGELVILRQPHTSVIRNTTTFERPIPRLFRQDSSSKAILVTPLGRRLGLPRPVKPTPSLLETKHLSFCKVPQPLFISCRVG
jgi:hypothetical protein